MKVMRFSTFNQKNKGSQTDCDLLQGNTSLSIRIDLSWTSLWIPTEYKNHTPWTELQEDDTTLPKATAHPQDSAV